MKKTDWREIELENNQKNNDTQSLWANFIQFPKQYDDNNTLLRAGADSVEYVYSAEYVNSAECDANLTCKSPTLARNRRSRQYGCRRYQLSRAPAFSYYARRTRQHLDRGTRQPRMF